MIGNDVLDAGLRHLAATAERIDICTRAPATCAEATGEASIGHATGVSVSEPEDVTGGRKANIRQVRGRVTARGKAHFWALTGGGALLAVGPLDAKELVPGVEFELPPIVVGLMR